MGKAFYWLSLCPTSRFYEEIGTPLLSDIRINYTSGSVDHVTQHLFANYFNGSEMVVAGKLSNTSAASLRVQVTASNNDKTLILETDVPLRRRESETEKHVKAAAARIPGAGDALKGLAADLVRRVWGFVTVKEELRSRLCSRSGREREEHVERATNLSLAYRFLTPVTKMLVDKPEVLADGTMARMPAVDEPASSPANEVPDDIEMATLHREADRQSLTLSNNLRGKFQSIFNRIFLPKGVLAKKQHHSPRNFIQISNQTESIHIIDHLDQFNYRSSKKKRAKNRPLWHTLRD